MSALTLVQVRPLPSAAVHPADQELLGQAPLPAIAELSVAPGEAITAAGAVQSILEGVIVVRVSPGEAAGGGHDSNSKECGLCWRAWLS